jgi:competence protein ComEC
LQTNAPCRILSFGLLALPALLLFFPLHLFGQQQPRLTYSARWIWGGLFTCMLLFLSIQLTAYHENRTSHPHPLQKWARHTQQQLTASFSSLKLTDTERSVLATITLGNKSTMPKEVRQQFSVAGVAHILSVSGFHVAIVCRFLLQILSPLSGNNAGRWIRYLLTLLLLWTFTTVSGLAAPAVRAATMLTFHLTGRQLDRTADGYNILAASAFCMLVYNPFYLYDAGFQLSYTAVGFILYLKPPLSRLIQAKNPALKTPWEWITLTLAAQTGTTFLCLHHFGRLSTVFLFTNLPLTPITTLLIPSALLWIFLPANTPGYPMLQFAVEKLTHAMMRTVDTFSHLPGSSLTFRFDLITTLLSYAALLSLFLYNEKRHPAQLITSLSLLLLIIIQKILTTA